MKDKSLTQQMKNTGQIWSGYPWEKQNKPFHFPVLTVFKALSEASPQPPCRGLKVSGRIQTNI